jgi:hypothetical protein
MGIKLNNMKNISLLILTFLLSTIFVFGQSTTGRIVGSISAPGDAGAIPGATIVVTDNQTGRERTVTSGEDGTFEVPQLEFGLYTIKISATGYKTFTTTDVKIDAGREYPLNAVLEVGVATEEVTVTAGAEQINATNGELSTTVSPQQIRELPLNGRNPLSLLNLQAGVNATSGSINGQRTSSVNYTRDGLNVQDNFIRNGFVSDQPTVDDTGEFNVITQNGGAEQGQGGSTQVQLVTPRGGSEFHGALFAFNRNSEFSANTFLNNASKTPRTFLNRNQFGGSISGPLPLPGFNEGGPVFIKDKGFFFFNYEGFRLANQVTVTNLQTLVPAARNGTFTYLASNGTTQTVNVLTGAGLNLAPTANAAQFNAAGGALTVDPIIQRRILDLLPNAGNNGTSTGLNLLQGYNINRSNPEIRNGFAGRFDLDINDRNSLNFVYKRNNISDARTDVAAGFRPDTTVSQGGPTNFFAAAYRLTIGSNFSNEIRGGFQVANPFFRNNGIASDYIIGLGGLGITQPENLFQDQGRDTFYKNIQDNAVYSIGNHSLRFGFNLDAYKITSTNLAGVTPTFNIATTANAPTPGFAGTVANSIFPGGISAADLARANNLRYLLAGIVANGNIQANLVNTTTGYQLGAPQIRKLNFEIYSGYIADQWRVNQNLTLNLGLRYDLFTPLNDPIGLYLEPQVTNFDNPIADLLNPNGVFVLAGTNAGRKGDFFKTDKDNFGPNFSFAYTPNLGEGFFGRLLPNSTVIRGGYRIGYVNDEYVRSADNAALNNAGLGSQTIPALTIRNGAPSAQLSAAFTPRGNFQALPGFTAPPITVLPRPYSLNNTAAAVGTNGTVSLIDPNLQNQKINEYSIGIQREVGFGTVFEIRYVGNRSDELVRSQDLNQLRIRESGFLADFIRAQNNCRLQAVASGFVPTATNPNPLFNCTSAAFNPAIPGSQPLTVFTQLGAVQGAANGGIGVAGGNSSANLLSFLAFDVPADFVAGQLIPGNVAGARNLFLNNPNAFVTNVTSNGGKLRYNSLQMELRRRFNNGFAFQANYTFQKTLTNIPTGEADQTRVAALLDNANPNLDYSRAQYDRTQTFNFNGVLELPFGRGKRFLNQGGILDTIFGGFQVSSIITLSTGAPLSILDNSGTLNRSGRSTYQSATSSLSGKEIKELTGVFKTPNGVFLIDPSVLYATGSNGQRVDLNQPLPPGVSIVGIRGAASQDQPTYAGQIFFYNTAGSTGNLPRNFFNGPKYINWDAGISKNFRFTESVRLQLRAEAFNVLNRANFYFSDPTTIFNLNNTTNFGQSTPNFYSPRILQFGARLDF